MDAYISGEGSVAYLCEKNGSAEQWWRMDRGEALRPSSEIGFLTHGRMGGLNDWEVLKDANEQTARRALDVASDSCRALHISIMLMDALFSEETGLTLARELADIINDADVRRNTENVLYCIPAPPGANIPLAIERAEKTGVPHVADLYRNLQAEQPIIAEVRKVWQEMTQGRLDQALTQSMNATLVKKGVFADLAHEWSKAVTRGEPAERTRAACREVLVKNIRQNVV